MKKPTFEAAALLPAGTAAAGALAIALGFLPPGPLLAQGAVLCIGAAGSALALRKRKAAGLRRIAEAAGVPQADSETEVALLGALTRRLAAADEHRLPAAAARACEIPMTVFDADDRPIFLNRSFVSFAQDLEHALGERSRDPKAGAAELLRHLRRRSCKGGAVEFVVGDATLEAVTSTLDTEGDPPALCVVWRDITPAAEARALIGAMTTADCLIMLDASGRIAEANEVAARLLGRRADDLAGERIETLFTAGDGLPDWRDMASGQVIRADLLPQGGGEEIGAAFYPLTGPDGHSVRTLCIGSPSRRSRRAAAILAAIGSAQAVIEFDAEGTVTGASDGACAVLGQAAGTLQGQSHDALCGASPSDTARIWECLTSGSPVEQRTTWPLREGGTRTLKVSYIPVMGSDARLESVLCCLTDMTEETDRLRRVEQSLSEERQVTEAMISDLESALERLAGGNLDCSLPGPFPERLEPVCRRFNEAVERQCDAFSRVLGSAETLRRSAEEAGAAAGEMAGRTESQASTLEQSAAALEQLTINVKASTVRNDQFETEVQGAMANATAAGSVVEEAFGAMDEIESSSRQISRIIGVIDDIAFQTNLLALNAGVEAARAGDAGRGFAVVASEVRALAQRSSEAAKEIKALISLSTEQVGRGVEVVGQSGAALKEVIASVHSIATMVAEVVASARDQSTGLGEIATAVSALDRTTQQTAAMVEDSTAAGQSLVHQADGLLAIAATFHLPEGRHRQSPVAPQVPKATITRLTPVTGGAALKVVDDDDDWTEF